MAVLKKRRNLVKGLSLASRMTSPHARGLVGAFRPAPPQKSPHIGLVVAVTQSEWPTLALLSRPRTCLIEMGVFKTKKVQ
jgi:hypothetical protein